MSESCKTLREVPRPLFELLYRLKQFQEEGHAPGCQHQECAGLREDLKDKGVLHLLEEVEISSFEEVFELVEPRIKELTQTVEYLTQVGTRPIKSKCSICSEPVDYTVYSLNRTTPNQTKLEKSNPHYGDIFIAEVCKDCVFKCGTCNVFTDYPGVCISCGVGCCTKFRSIPNECAPKDSEEATKKKSLSYYIATSVDGIPEYKALDRVLKASGFIPSYDWTKDNIEEDMPSDEKAVLKARNLEGILESDIVIVILPAWSETHFAMGFALGKGKRVILVGTQVDLGGLRGRECLYYSAKEVTRIRFEDNKTWADATQEILEELDNYAQ